MSKRFWRRLCLFFCVFNLVWVSFSIKNDNDLQDIIDSQNETIEKQRESSDKINANWEEAYNQLELDYGALMQKYYELESSTEMPVYSFTRAEVEMIAVCVQCESGVENSVSQRYVTQVILNRLSSSDFPDSVEEVIYQKDGDIPQFSVAYNGMMDEVMINDTLDDSVLLNVYRVIVFGTDLPSYVKYFYSDSLTESWCNSLNTYLTTEGTVFAYEKGDVQ